MKTTLILILISLSFSISAQTTKTMTDPVLGADVKVGKKPPSSGQIIATGVTDETGSFEVKDLETGDFIYYFEFGIKEQGNKGPVTTILSKEFKINYRANDSKPTLLKEIHGVYEIICTISSNGTRGSVVTSRSNIKVTILKSNSINK